MALWQNLGFASRWDFKIFLKRHKLTPDTLIKYGQSKTYLSRIGVTGRRYKGLPRGLERVNRQIRECTLIKQPTREYKWKYLRLGLDFQSFDFDSNGSKVVGKLDVKAQAYTDFIRIWSYRIVNPIDMPFLHLCKL